MEIRTYDKDAPCPKCGSHYVTARYVRKLPPGACNRFNYQKFYSENSRLLTLGLEEAIHTTCTSCQFTEWTKVVE